MEDHILDLDKRLWATTRYGLTAIGTWVRIDGRWRPAMAIVRPGFNPAVIPLEDAWHWSDVIGEPQMYASRMCVALGVDAWNLGNVDALISLVNSRMADLVAMPPRPPDAEEHEDPVAELTINNELHGKLEVEL